MGKRSGFGCVAMTPKAGALKESMAALWAADDIVNASIGDPPEADLPVVVKDEVWLDTVDHHGVKAKPSIDERVAIATRITQQRAKHGVT